jgi:hypothetical protein
MGDFSCQVSGEELDIAKVGEAMAIAIKLKVAVAIALRDFGDRCFVIFTLL